MVINVDEEYTFLRFSNMQVTKQSLSHKDGHAYDIMVCKDMSDKGREVTAYFNVDIPTQSLRDALARRGVLNCCLINRQYTSHILEDPA